MTLLVETRTSEQSSTCNFCRFVVEADEDMPSMTFIAEYSGEVDYMRCCQYDSGNSIMGLLFSDDPVKELVICPDRRGNIARFLSGINNHRVSVK